MPFVMPKTAKFVPEALFALQKAAHRVSNAVPGASDWELA